MKKRLLSLALALCLLAALLPAGVLTAQAASETFTIYVSVTSPGEGGDVRSIAYRYKSPHIDYSSPTYTYGFNYTWTGVDENGCTFRIENQSLKASGIKPLPGGTCHLDVTFGSPGVPYGESMIFPAQWNTTQRESWVFTDYKGDSKQIHGSYDWYNGESTLHVRCNFSPSCCPIETVDLAMTAPVAGQPVDFSAVSYRPEELAISDSGANFHFHGVRWTDKTEGLAVTGGSFKAGHEYEASIYVEAADDYHYFRKDGPAAATINGFPAQITDVSEDHSHYEITYSFPASYVPVTGVTLNKTSTSIAAGNSETLTATVTPANAAAKGVVWTSSDKSVASVNNNGRVTAAGEGTATITATTKDGGKTASCLVTVTAPEEYELEIDGVQVTSLNRRDVLRNSYFSFDGDHTLTVKGSYSTDKRLIYNRGIDGLVIRAEGINYLRTTSGEAIITKKNMTITGPGTLMLRSGDDCGIFVSGLGATLTIRDADLDVSGHWGIAAQSRENSTKLVIDHASVTAKGESSAVCDFQGGITLKHCELVKPEGGSIIGWGDIVDADGNRAAEVQIDATALENPFVDVHESDFFYDPVLWAYYNEPQITAGTDETHFSPAKTVLRSDAMVFFWAAQGRPTVEAESNPFKDVSDKHWAHKAVMWAVKNGITGGTDKTHFSPSRTCSRSEILQFLYASMGKPGYSIENPYSDINTNHWYYDGAIWAYEKGLEKGEEGKFNATTPCTRAYVVTYLYRFMTRQALAE